MDFSPGNANEDYNGVIPPPPQHCEEKGWQVETCFRLEPIKMHSVGGQDKAAWASVQIRLGRSCLTLGILFNSQYTSWTQGCFNHYFDRDRSPTTFPQCPTQHGPV